MAHKSRKVSSKRQRDDDRQDDSEGSDASDQRSLQQPKRSRLFHGQDPTSVDQIPSMSNKIRTWDESEIRRLVLRAVEPPFLCASAIHPTASILADCISVPRVPLSIFKITCPLLRSDPRTSAWKCEFFRRQTSAHATASRSKRGRLVITMPSRIHEAFVTFGTNICDQLYNSGFLPTRYKRNEILQTGSVEFDYGSVIMAPDASVSFFGSRDPFLVLEVAYSEKEEHAQRKAQDYILLSKGKVIFVVLVIVKKRPRKKPNKADPPTTRPSENGDENLSADHDTVHVHVYKSVIQPASESRPHRTLTGKQVIDRLPVFPSPLSVPNQTFDIGWADIKCGTWSDFCKNAHLPDNTPSPVCAINFASLVSIARRLAGQINDSRENTPLYRPVNENDTPVSQTTKFLASSSPAPYLSDEGSDSSGRRSDPDYQPSEGSSGSSSSC